MITKIPLLVLLTGLCLTAPSFAATHKVIYEVPAPEALAPFSRFELTYESHKLANGETELVYRLPALLLGFEQEFRFRGRIEPGQENFTLRAPKGEMSCSRLPGHALCRVMHKEVQVDLIGVRDALERLPISREEKLGRFELSSLVARAGGDLAGLLTYVPGLDY